MQKKQKKTALLILNYNNYEDTINCIESVEKYNSSPIKYIVVDNGSTRADVVENLHDYFTKTFGVDYFYHDESKSLNIEEPLKYLTLLVSDSNDGYAQGNNKGLKLAYQDDEIEHIMVLNNDVLFVEDIIPSLLDKKKELPDCAIISPVLYKKGLKELDYNCARLNHSEWEIINTYLMLYRDLFGYISKKNTERKLLLRFPEYMNKEHIEIELPSGSCMLMNKSFIQEIGGFDPNTFLYFEENILYKKISKLGLKNYLLTKCKCIHLGASSTSKSPSNLIQKISIQSANYYLKQYTCLTYIQLAFWNLALFFNKIKYYILNKWKL